MDLPGILKVLMGNKRKQIVGGCVGNVLLLPGLITCSLVWKWININSGALMGRHIHINSGALMGDIFIIGYILTLGP